MVFIWFCGWYDIGRSEILPSRIFRQCNVHQERVASQTKGLKELWPGTSESGLNDSCGKVPPPTTTFKQTVSSRPFQRIPPAGVSCQIDDELLASSRFWMGNEGNDGYNKVTVLILGNIV